MHTLAKQYKSSIVGQINTMELVGIARENLADLYSNNEYSWIEFCDGSILSHHFGDIKAFNKLQSFHKNGVEF